MIEFLISVIISAFILGIIAYYIRKYFNSEPKLNLNGHFRPRRHFFFEKCSKCGKRLKHYHWFWGKGDTMFYEVDYHGNTTYYCETCDAEMQKNYIHEIPHD
jgi:hypothetical protein